MEFCGEADIELLPRGIRSWVLQRHNISNFDSKHKLITLTFTFPDFERNPFSKADIRKYQDMRNARTQWVGSYMNATGSKT
jgi:hypothetical protein